MYFDLHICFIKMPQWGMSIMVFTENLWFLSGVTTVLLQKTWQVCYIIYRPSWYLAFCELSVTHPQFTVAYIVTCRWAAQTTCLSTTSQGSTEKRYGTRNTVIVCKELAFLSCSSCFPVVGVGLVIYHFTVHTASAVLFFHRSLLLASA